MSHLAEPSAAPPILYSFRRCPYAIRARMTINYCNILVELREVVLRNKPTDMLAHSPKGTVPVLILPDGRVIDESWEVITWALSCHDPDRWFNENTAQTQETIKKLVHDNDMIFKKHLDQYKYAIRYPEKPMEYYREQGATFLQSLEDRLTMHKYLIADQIMVADIAIFPFIRQFAFVDKTWFDQAPYPQLQNWLNHFLESNLFLEVMKKYSPWCPTDPPLFFP